MRRTRITIVTRERLTLPPNILAQPEAAAWCEGCAARVVWLTPEQSAGLCAGGARQIYRWVETGALHFAEQADLSLRICGPSLLALTAHAH